jgi:pentose-5-phosphate-3-epimerase
MERVPGQLSASGSLTHIDLTDTTYITALTSGNPVVIEVGNDPTNETPSRFWAFLNQNQITAAVADLQKTVVTWTASGEWLNATPK